MKVSFDLDGTAWSYRPFFSALAAALQAAGHQVGILTGHADDFREPDLRLWRARGFPEPDFYYNSADIGAESFSGDLREWKLAFARKVGIDCHIDDWDNRHPDQIEMALLMEKNT